MPPSHTSPAELHGAVALGVQAAATGSGQPGDAKTTILEEAASNAMIIAGVKSFVFILFVYSKNLDLSQIN